MVTSLIFQLNKKPQLGIIEINGDHGKIKCRYRKTTYEYAMKHNRKFLVAYYGDQYYALKPIDYIVNNNFIPDSNTPDHICEFISQII